MTRARKLTSEELLSYAVKKLAGRAASAGEVRSALMMRAQNPADIEPVMARLKEYGYLNDARFAESFATARLENEGFGRGRVLRDLRQHRVSPEVAERAAEKVYADRDETVLIEQFIRRKYRMSDRDNLFKDDKEMASAFRRLLRAGFTTGNSIRVLKRFAANPDLLDQMEDAPPEDTE